MKEEKKKVERSRLAIFRIAFLSLLKGILQKDCDKTD